MQNFLNFLNNKKGDASFLPIIAMKDIIIYPQIISPLIITDESSKLSINNAGLTEGREVILLAENNQLESGYYSVGILGKIIQTIKFPDGNVKALVEGVNRIKVFNIREEQGIDICEYSMLNDSECNVNTEETKALTKIVNEKFQEYIQKKSQIDVKNFISVSETENPSKLADIVATYLNISISEKQIILEILDVLERLQKVNEIITRELETLNIEEALKEKIDYKLGKTQKEFILKEKLKAIKEELGNEGELDEVDEIKSEIINADVPDFVREHLLKEANKLERMTIYTAENSLIRTYIEAVLSLPWNVKSDDIIDIEKAQKILDEDHYGLQDPKERIIEFLAVRQLSKRPQATIICLVGPPGTGKTSLARSIARSLDKNFTQVSLGGINDESEIRGHRRTYIGAMPGRIIKAVQEAKTKNPLILLDEIEKMLPSHMGDPTAAMLEVLDPAQNSHFTDHYIDIPFDLSEVFFIATANSIENLYKPLKDRMEIIYLSSYTEEEKLNIAKKYLIKRQFDANGISCENLSISDSAINCIINSYTKEAGVRELERKIGKICRKLAVKIAKNEKNNDVITPDNLSEYLGVAKFKQEDVEKYPQVGLAHGLAWTEVGGELLNIEASIMPGSGKLLLTGRLGEIMQESAKTALSYIRSNHKKLGIPEDLETKYDIHVHAPDGATPKDGPSAGIALTIAVISALTGREVRADYSMTGEITLRGRILPIGGLKEKCIASLRNKIFNLVIPKSNEKDLTEIPDYVKDKINFIIVDDFSELIDKLLLEKKEVKVKHNGAKHKDAPFKFTNEFLENY